MTLCSWPPSRAVNMLWIEKMGKEMPDGDDGDALLKNEYYEGFEHKDTERDWVRVVRHDE